MQGCMKGCVKGCVNEGWMKGCMMPTSTQRHQTYTLGSLAEESSPSLLTGTIPGDIGVGVDVMM